MRVELERNADLFYHPIETAEIPSNCRDQTVALFAALKYMYVNTAFRDKIIEVLESRFSKKMRTGKKGLNLWQIFVLANLRLCLDISYDRIHYMVNHDQLLRHIVGIRDYDNTKMTQLEYQRIYDNVNILTDEIIKELNEDLVGMGHEVFKKKRNGTLALKDG